MADSGIRHVVSSVPVPRSEYEDQDHHALIHGTSFPAGPTERQLYYRDDLHAWYIYNGSSWVSLQAAAIDHLNDIDDVQVPSPSDQDLLYYDNATGLWKCKAHTDLTTGVHGVGSNHLCEAPAASHLVRSFTKGWTSDKALRGNGVDADPEEAFDMFPDRDWINECWLVDPDNAASLWATSKNGADFNEKLIGRLDLKTDGNGWGEYIRLYSDRVPGGTYAGSVVIAHTQWAGTDRTSCEVYLGLWEYNTSQRPSLTAKHFGWKIINGSIYATIADGATENAEDTGEDYSSNWDTNVLKVVINDSGNFEFYVNDVWKCTLSTNKPSFTSSLVYIDLQNTAAVDRRFMLRILNWMI